MNPPLEPKGPIPEGTAELLRETGHEGAFTLTPLSGGANNRVYRVDGPASPLVLKSFYHTPGDARDRFGAEKAFYDFLAAVDLKGATPDMVASNPSSRLALFSWIEGTRLGPAEVDRDVVEQALHLYLRLNAGKHLPAAQNVPTAAEACFTPTAHLHSVERRVQRLEKLEAKTELEEAVAGLVRNQLRPSLARAWQGFTKSFPRPEEPLPENLRCVSPSDFGFHNALRTNGGRLVFFDFEYAGWDDPLKFICDFLCQPEIPVPPSLRARCLELLDPALPGGVNPRHALALLPLYYLKWCCLMLNEFLPTEQKRRLFAQGRLPEELRRKQARQYERVSALLAKFDEIDWA